MSNVSSADSNSHPGPVRNGFGGAKVLAFESRRALEMARLIANFGGVPLLAPAVREVPLEADEAALEFAAALLAGRIGAVIFLTGAGTRMLMGIVERAYPRAQFITALSRVPVIARGPKPVAALREFGVPVALTVPEPNTWREMLQMLDGPSGIPLRGMTVAIQEYGAASNELRQGLVERGANVLPVPVYTWQLPEELDPLRTAVATVVAGDVDVLLFTAAVQVRHFLAVARKMDAEVELKNACDRVLIASIGPATSAELRAQQLLVHLEPSHPKMGILVKETADRVASVRKGKSTASAGVFLEEKAGL
ncbi:MAG: uroporphyrinogen-III synthase [Terriglobales bacterium]